MGFVKKLVMCLGRIGDIEQQLMQFVKHQKQDLEKVTIEMLEFLLNSFKNKEKLKYKKIDIDALPSSLDKYIGIVNESEVDLDYKHSRDDYLKEKYL